jgi:S1-C subfamily serine protease
MEIVNNMCSKRMFIVLVVILIISLSGCATSYNSVKLNDQNQYLVIQHEDSELIRSAIREAIFREFPEANIASSLNFSIDYRWRVQPLLDATNFRLVLSKHNVVLLNDENSFAFVYNISTTGTQGLVDVRYVDPLNQRILEVFSERGIPRLPVKQIKNAVSVSQTNKPAGGAVSKYTGTGYFINNSGTFVTNAHVVADAKSIEIEFNSVTYTPRLLAIDTANDLAVLDIDATTPSLALVTSVNVGDEITVLGFPLIGLQGQEIKATFGNVNALSGIQGDIRLLQMDASVQSGNSGSPILNIYGNVIGTVTSKMSDLAMLRASGELPQNLNYGVKNAYLLPIAAEHIENVQPRSQELSKAELVKLSQESIFIIYVNK